MESTIYNYQTWVEETDPGLLQAKLSELLAEVGYTVLNFVEHHFSPQGYTCLWLLSESHLAVHTFPENNKTYVELSGCDKNKSKYFKKRVETIFQPIRLQEL